MKLYANLDVNLTYQNYGSTWALTMRGKTEHIEQAVNGLFNWGATNGDCEYYDHTQTVAVIWTDEPSMRRFFYLQALRKMVSSIEYVRTHTAENRILGKLAGKRISEIAHVQAERRIRALRHRHEKFFNFTKSYMPETHGTGQITAERPDLDMKDSILINAHVN